MGKRGWLEELIETEYLPAIEQMQDTPEGRQQAQELNQRIRDGWAERGSKAINQQQPLMDRTVQAIKEKFGKDHFSLQFIKLSRDENFDLNRQKQGRARERQMQQQYLKDPEAIVATAVRLLESSDWTEVACGLAVLTGRRLNEVVRTAEFEYKDQWIVTFRGALKRRGEEVPLIFDIPPLTTAQRVLDATAKLRQITPPDADESKVKDASNQHFAGLVPVPGAEQNIYTHLWRSVYACIACFWYCPKHCDDLLFKAHILGHFETLNRDEQQGEKLRQRLETFASDRHYRLYEIDDDLIALHKGKRKGIKLGHGGIKPLDAFINAMPENQPTPQPRKHTSTIRAWKEDFDGKMGDILMHFAEGKTQQDKVSAWMNWTLAKLNESPSDQAEPEASTTITTATTAPIAATAEPEQTAEPEATQPKAIQEDAIQPESIQSAQPAQVQAEQSNLNGLESAVKELVGSMREFMQFQMELQRQGQPPTAPAPARTATRTKPSVAVPTQIAPEQEPGDAGTSPAIDAGTAPKTRGRYRSGEDEALANRAIDAIIAHNNRMAPNKDLMWRMTNNAIKNLTGSSNQRAIARVIEARQKDIDENHNTHQLAENHNDRHKHKRKVHEEINFPHQRKDAGDTQQQE